MLVGCGCSMDVVFGTQCGIWAVERPSSDKRCGPPSKVTNSDLSRDESHFQKACLVLILTSSRQARSPILIAYPFMDWKEAPKI